MAERKRIAIFHCGFIYSGGGERIVLEELSTLRKRGYKVDCFAPVYNPDMSYPDIIKQYKIRTFLPQLPGFFPFRYAFLMVASCILSPIFAFRFIKYDLILGANQPGAFIAWVVAGVLRKPYYVYLNQPNRILYPRDNENWQNVKDYYFLNNIINKLFKRFVAYVDRKSITNSKNLFINGSFVAKEICEIYKPNSWIDCPGGANAVSQIDHSDRLEGELVVNSLKIKKPYILLTSRHEPWKKFDWAIKVIKIVSKRHRDVKLVIPGIETALTPVLKLLVNSLNIKKNVIFTGVVSQSDLWRLYRHAAIYIFTSPREDLGIVVQEAQAAGVPVVAWNAGGPTVTVINEKTGYLVESFRLSSMAEKVQLLLENPRLREQMGKNAVEHIKNNFSWERHVDILEKNMLLSPAWMPNLNFQFNYSENLKFEEEKVLE